MLPKRYSTPLSYVLALITPFVALLLTLFIEPLHHLPSVLFVAAVVFTAWYGGLVPSLISGVLSALLLDYFFLPPLFKIVPGVENLLQIGVFLMVSMAMGLLHQQRGRALAMSQAERERFRVTLGSIGDAVLVSDPAGAVTFMNGVAETLTGWTLDQARGKPVHEVFRIVNEITDEPVEGPVKRVIQSGQIVGLANHTSLIRRDGTRISIDDSGAPIRDEQGRLIGVILVFRDITARRQAEQRNQALYELTARLSAASTVDEVSDAILDTSLAAFRAHIGVLGILQPDEETVRLISAHGRQAPVVEKYSAMPVDHKSPLTDAIRSGQLIWIDSFADLQARYPEIAPLVPRTSAGYSVASVPLVMEERAWGALQVGMPEDRRFDDPDKAFFISLAQQCAQALERARLFEREANARREAEWAQDRTVLLQQVTAELSMANTSEDVGRVIVNTVLPALGGHLGSIYLLAEDERTMEPAGKTGASPLFLETYPTLSLDHPSALPTAVRTGEPVIISNLEEYVQRFPEVADILLRTTHSRATACFPLISKGRTLGGLGISFPRDREFSDADRALMLALAQQSAQTVERVQLFEAEAKARRLAEEANESKVRFLAMVTHELRAPLSSIKGFASSLLSTDVQWGPAEQRSFIEIISEESDRMAELIEHLLDLSRIQSGSLRIQKEPTTLQAIVGSAMPQLATLAAQHRLQVDIPGDLPPIDADTHRISQVLANLVGNAAKYSPPNSPIEVRALSDQQHIRLEVADQGPGIAPQDRDRLFQPFQQLGHQREGEKKGAGLGLAISKGLIEAHGGRIWIASNGDRGTRVCFTLPVAAEP